jgi:hypothetical protein
MAAYQEAARVKRPLLAAAVLACAVVTACSPAVSAVTVSGTSAPGAAVAVTHGLKQVRDPGRVTGTITGHCNYRNHGWMPDARCTPGSIDPIVTQSNIRSTICKAGWTKTVRPPEWQTDAFKYDVAYPAYGTPRNEKTELDHLVPLELGGASDATNLWPEYPPDPNPKGKVENTLNTAVCDGRVSLSAAQVAIAKDWMTTEKVLGLGSATTAGSGPAATGKPWCTASASPANHGYSGDYNVHISSNQPDREATASDAGDTWQEYTGSTGTAAITLWHTSPGETIKVTVGGASCTTRA